MSTEVVTGNVKTWEKRYRQAGEPRRLVVSARFDDECHNGHRTFAITATEYGPRGWECCGCLHDDIRREFPELAEYIKWHLVSEDEPMHYVANALYWAGFSGWCNGGDSDPPNYEHLASTIVYGAVPGDEQVDLRTIGSQQLREWLAERLPALQVEFRRAMESIGFVW